MPINDTKLKADIAEYAVLANLLNRGFKCLTPIGDRLPYDLAIDLNGKLLRIQVKNAWKQKDFYVVDTRRTQTNRRFMKRSRYEKDDFDFAILYISEGNIFYIMPFDAFSSYKSGIALVEQSGRQRPPKSHSYREAWHLLM